MNRTDEVILSPGEDRHLQHHQNEELFHLITDNVLDVIALIDINFNFLYVSPSAARMLGYTVEEIMGRTADSFLEPSMRNEILQVLKEAIMQVEAGLRVDTANREMVFIHKNGSPIWVENRMKYLRNKEGKIDRFMAVIRDITDRKEFEKRLIESECRFRMLAENISDVMFTTDKDLFLTYISPSISNLTGFTPEESLKITWEKAMTPDSLKLLIHAGDSIIPCHGKEEESPPDRMTFQLELYHKNGSTVQVESTITFVWTNDNSLQGIVGVFRDISAKKKAEEALRQSEEKYRVLVETSRDFIFTCDVDGTITFANSCLDELLHDIRGTGERPGIFNIVAPDDRIQFETAFQLAITRAKPVINFETRIPLREDPALYVNLNLSPQRNQDGEITGIMGIGHDITVRKKIECDLVDRNRELNDFAYMVSHELKNPIQIIKGFLNFIHNDPKLFEKYFDRVMRQSDQLLHFIDNVLQLSRAGRIIGEKTCLDLHLILRRAYHMAKPEDLNARLHIREGVPAGLMGDPKSFEQVFQNLIKNAFNNRDLSKETLCIEIGCEKAGSNIIISVSDNGMGIKETYLKRIFEAGFTVKRGVGTGFGLAIVKKIVEAYEGSIWVASDGESKGATFSIQLPASIVLDD